MTILITLAAFMCIIGIIIGVVFLLDKIIRDSNYYTSKKKEKKEKEIEELNNHIYIANITDKMLEEEREAICNKIKKYVADNNLKWAKKWGW